MSGVKKFLQRLTKRPPVVSVLRLNGAIGSAGRFGRGLSDAALAPQVERAFAPSRLAAVALAVNSPGGAPTQSALIADRIRDFAAEKKVPVLAFCEDVAASGGYWLACAADEIFVEENSIIGSIGVVSASFGLHEAIAKLGVERRLQTAGESKARLDPFLPEKPEDKAWLAELQKRIHGNFIAMVKRARGDRLSSSADLFTGDVWLGEEAVSLGLADGVGRLRPVLRERYGEDVRIDVVTPRRSLLERLSGGAVASPAAPLSEGGGLDADRLLEGALEAVERRALWSRFGL